MISAGNISNAIKRLGGNETTNIVDLIKNMKQDNIDRLIIRLRSAVRRGDTSNVTFYSGKIDRLKTQITELDQKFKETLGGNCCICIDKIEKPVLLPCCQNVFCGTCILEWLKTNTRCPMCRSDVAMDKIIYIKDEKEKEKERKEEDEQPKLLSKPK